MTVSLRPAFLLPVAAFMAATAWPVTAAWAVQASAYAVGANLGLDGQAAKSQGPLLPVAGNLDLGQTFDVPAKSALLTRTWRLGAGNKAPVLSTLVQQAAADATGTSGVDAVDTQGSASLAAGVVSLGTLTASTGALNIRFSKVRAQSSYHQIFPRAADRSGSTQLGVVVLSGNLIGPKPLTFQGPVAPNTVVLDTPTITVTLNAQAIPQQPVCSPGLMCPLYRVLETVETQAVQVLLKQAKVGGHVVSGQIVVGDAEAGQ